MFYFSYCFISRPIHNMLTIVTCYSFLVVSGSFRNDFDSYVWFNFYYLFIYFYLSLRLSGIGCLFYFCYFICVIFRFIQSWGFYSDFQFHCVKILFVLFTVFYLIIYWIAFVSLVCIVIIFEAVYSGTGLYGPWVNFMFHYS
jgi:hypothetical protein